MDMKDLLDMYVASYLPVVAGSMARAEDMHIR